MEGWIFDKEKKNDFASVPPVHRSLSKVFSIFFLFWCWSFFNNIYNQDGEKKLYHFTKFSYSFQIWKYPTFFYFEELNFGKLKILKWRWRTSHDGGGNGEFAPYKNLTVSIFFNPYKNGTFGALCKMYKNMVSSLQLVKKCKRGHWHNIKVSTAYWHYISFIHNFYFSGFNFLDMLIK